MKKINILNNKKTSSGFTLIEVMISIGLFTVIMIVGITSVLGVNNTYRKTRSMRAAIDNLSFVMEDMARNIRLGSYYRCIGDISEVSIIDTNAVGDGTNCAGIVFQPFWSPIPNANTKVVYFISEDGDIFKSLSGGLNPEDYSPMNSVDINIDWEKSRFEVYGSDQSDTIQPSVLITLVGTASSGGVSTDFNLQTRVSQRLLDLQ